jgi:hypothetical protein
MSSRVVGALNRTASESGERARTKREELLGHLGGIGRKLSSPCATSARNLISFKPRIPNRVNDDFEFGSSNNINISFLIVITEKMDISVVTG